MSNSERPSAPSPALTPDGGFLRPGLVYVDDSALALSSLRRALYEHSILIDTYASRAALRDRASRAPIIAALLDVDLGEGTSGFDVASDIRAEFPRARIAFFTAEISAARIEALSVYGPVLAKSSGLDAAIEWLLAAYRDLAHAPPQDESEAG